MKIILSDSILSIIFKEILISLNIFVILYLIFTPNVWREFIVTYMLVMTLILFLLSNFLFGYIKITGTNLFVPNNCTTKKNRIQNKITIDIKDIEFIEFLAEDCTSDGNKIAWRYTGIPPYLKLYMKDNSIFRIHLIPFSHKTWKNLEKELLKINNSIIILKDADSFIKLIKN